MTEEHTCRDSKTTLRLEPGQTNVFAIYARLEWNDTLLQVRTGERYTLIASGCWHDASIQSCPNGDLRSKFWFRCTERFRRRPTDHWFALIGCIDQDLSTAFLVGKKTSVTIPSTGSLNCFANDVPLFYWNNSGAIKLEVIREI